MMNRSQLEWRCRRGVRELDVLFTRFLKDEYDQLADQDQLAFQSLLAVQDPEIMDWLFNKSAPDSDELGAIVTKLQTLSGIK